MRRREFLFAAGALTGCKFGPPKFELVTNEFVYTTLAFSPVTATAHGYHRHAGTSLDEQIDDWSESALARRRKWYREFRDGIAGTKTERLTPEDRADFDLIAAQITRALDELDGVQTYKHSPQMYVALAERALVTAQTWTDAPEELRAFHTIRRLELYPKLFEHARKNLVDAWAPVDITSALGGVEQARAKLPAALRPKGDVAGLAATASLKSFAEFAATLPGSAPPATPMPPEAAAVLAVIGPRLDERAKPPAPASRAELEQFLRARAVLPLPQPLPSGATPTDVLAAITTDLPGERLQAHFADQLQPGGRHLLRTLYSPIASRVGWGEYALHLMVEEGFRRADPAFEQAQLRHLAQTCQERPHAFAGWRDYLRIREAYRTSRGRGFLLSEFHGRLLTAGPLPAETMCRLLTGNATLPAFDAAASLPIPPQSQ
jgi:hypothetical protein